MQAATRYLQLVRAQLEQAAQQQEAIGAAAGLVARAIGGGGLWHLFGTGHSHLLAEEMFYRAGGLAAVNPILEEGLMLHRGAAQSTALERLAGLADVVLDQQPTSPGDALLIVSNSGRNAVPIEMALAARRKGIAVISLSSLQSAAVVTSRHASGRLLHELADVALDNMTVPGDAALDIDGVAQRVCATSTVTGAALLQAVAAAAIEQLAAAGGAPAVFASSNGDAGDAHNRALIQRYKGAVRCL
ncbi:SIS domain-containing protein [Paenibacillus sp. IB182496]|uniref:SIS domain-containing protein n=1 Tax=Paenibacillus sabuli TaxID=2772509 RepID=A0A927BR80_9BACL|nr:SIS domain-containing protein [Paenibacillus sabuli]MBD2843998.1 SIS domain-containing protein [Paenibacillus sabuli]